MSTHPMTIFMTDTSLYFPSMSFIVVVLKAYRLYGADPFASNIFFTSLLNALCQVSSTWAAFSCDQSI